MKLRLLKLLLCLGVVTGVGAGFLRGYFPLEITPAVSAQGGGGRVGTQSSPIAVTPDNRFVWVCNPDTDTVSVINVQNDANQKVAEIRVGDEPNNLAISPDGRLVYVANTISGTVSVINTITRQVIRNIRVGTEPYGLALTPNGRRLYCVNARSNDISVIHTGTLTVDFTMRYPAIGDEPRAIAITDDGDDLDWDETVFVANFNGVDRLGTLIGADDYKEGRVFAFKTIDDIIFKDITLAPIANVGFNSNGSALRRIPATTTTPPTFDVATGAFPNSLNSIAIKGNRAYLPNNAASPDGPVRFNVNVQSFLNVIDLTTCLENGTINMNRGIQFEPASDRKLFLGMPWHMAFEHNRNRGWVVAMAANILVRVDLDQNGNPTINAPRQAGDAGNIVRIECGQKPIGVAINGNDTRAYVANEVSRDVTIINLNNNQVIRTVSSADLPRPGTDDARLLYGKGVFFSSAKVNLPTLGPVIPVGRLSSEGWSGCVSCHANGLTDQVVWIFGAGPRRSLPFNGTFNPHNRNDQKILNYSAIFDEVQDFENNIRGTSGGLGLITTNGQVDGPPDPLLNAFTNPNTGRSRALDDLNFFIARGIRGPVSPLRNVAPNSVLGQQIAFGRRVFIAMNCQQCHGGGGWSTARRDFTPPPVATDVVNGQIQRLLRQVGTFNPLNLNEIRQNGAAPLGADGYAAPSLLGAFGLGPLLHNGTGFTFADVLANTTHRRAGLRPGQDDVLNNNRTNRDALVRFLQSIDETTPPIGTIAADR